jgi:MoaA/NifB/PqqE/SkfB family radical SAM enzyme
MIYPEFKDLIQKASYVPLKPALIARIIKNYFKLIFLNKKPLRYITVWATWRCQCRCNYCSNFHLRQSISNKKALSLKDYERIFTSAKKLGSINIHFVGGEPLVGEELLELIKIARPRTTIVSMATNGILLKKKAQELRKAGMDFANVSLDSPYAQIHDKVKHVPGAFKDTIEGIKFAKDVGLKIIITMVINHQNLNNGEVEDMVKLSGSLGVVLQLLPVRPMGNYRGNLEMLLNKDDMHKLYRLVSSWNVRWDGRSNYLKTGCPAGIEKLTINMFGDVYPCAFIPLHLGNLFEKSLEDIYYSTISSPAFKDWSPVCRSAFNDEFIKKYCDFDGEGCS